MAQEPSFKNPSASGDALLCRSEARLLSLRCRGASLRRPGAPWTESPLDRLLPKSKTAAQRGRLHRHPRSPERHVPRSRSRGNRNRNGLHALSIGGRHQRATVSQTATIATRRKERASDNKVRRVEHEDGTATYTVEVTMDARVFDSILEAARVEGVSGNEFMVGAACREGLCSFCSPRAVRICELRRV